MVVVWLLHAGHRPKGRCRMAWLMCCVCAVCDCAPRGSTALLRATAGVGEAGVQDCRVHENQSTERNVRSKRARAPTWIETHHKSKRSCSGARPAPSPPHARCRPHDGLHFFDPGMGPLPSLAAFFSFMAALFASFALPPLGAFITAATHREQLALSQAVHNLV